MEEDSRGEGAAVEEGETEAVPEAGANAPATNPAEAELGVEPGGDGGVTETAAPEPTEAERLRAELAESRRQGVASHRRALLAENAGKVVPELVQGETVEALDGSVAAALAAYQSIRASVVAELGAAAHVGGSNGTRGAVVDVEAMTPVGKIAYGLRPARE